MASSSTPPNRIPEGSPKTIEYLSQQWSLDKTGHYLVRAPPHPKLHQSVETKEPPIENSKFLALPLELREKIYRHVINSDHHPQQRGICSLKCVGRYKHNAEIIDILNQLLLLSRQINREAKSVFIRECIIKSTDFFRSVILNTTRLFSLWRFCYGKMGSNEVMQTRDIKTRIEICTNLPASPRNSETPRQHSQRRWAFWNMLEVLDRNDIYHPGRDTPYSESVAGRKRYKVCRRMGTDIPTEGDCQSEELKKGEDAAEDWTVSEINCGDIRMVFVEGPLLMLE